MERAIDELVANAAMYEAIFENPDAGIAAKPAPTKRVAIVTCMDARIDTYRIFGLGAGDAHVLRNAGGLVTDDVLRSLVLSQRLLDTCEVILMHHTGCGMLGADEAALRAAIVEQTGHAPSYAFGSFTDLEEAVRNAITRVREHPFLPHRDHVRGFVYDVDTGHVREVPG